MSESRVNIISEFPVRKEEVWKLKHKTSGGVRANYSMAISERNKKYKK